jgi:hypothetical protein
MASAQGAVTAVTGGAGTLGKAAMTAPAEVQGRAAVRKGWKAALDTCAHTGKKQGQDTPNGWDWTNATAAVANV